MSVLNARHFHDEEAAFAELERILWPDGPVCPHCGAMDRIYALKGVRSKPSKKHPKGVERFGLKKCGHCKKQFTVRVGTVFEDSHAPLHKWFQAIHMMACSKKGVSSHQLHRMLEVQYNTAWFMSHRIREAMRAGGFVPAMGGEGSSGIVEADETYHGKVAEPRTTRKDGTPFKRSRAGRGPANKRAIVSLVERGGEVRSFHVEQANKTAVTEIVNANVAKEARLMTDESRLYGDADVAEHHTVRHAAGEYVRYENGEAIHSNTVESYFSVFKRGMRGTYQHCKEKHLHRYLAEFDFRHNNRSALGVEDVDRATKATVGAKGKRLTYRRTSEGVE